MVSLGQRYDGPGRREGVGSRLELDSMRRRKSWSQELETKGRRDGKRGLKSQGPGCSRTVVVLILLSCEKQTKQISQVNDEKTWPTFFRTREARRGKMHPDFPAQDSTHGHWV